jgi:hypothetical protein
MLAQLSPWPVLLVPILSVACEKSAKSEFEKHPSPVEIRSLVASLPVRDGTGLEGYKEARWGMDPATVAKTLPSKSKIVCGELDPEWRKRGERQTDSGGRWHELDNLDAPKDPDPEDFRKILHALYSTQNFNDEIDGVKTFLSALEHLNQQYLNLDADPLARHFSVARVGPGCGLFFQGRYLAQLNIVLGKLSLQSVVKTLAESVGPYRKIAEESAVELGRHCVYAFNGGRTIAMALIGSDRVATLYMDRQQLRELPGRLSESLKQQRDAIEAADKHQREQNSKRLKDDL